MYCTPDVIVLTRTNRGFLSRSSEWRGQHFLLAEEMALPPLSSSFFFSSLLFFLFPHNFTCWSQRNSSGQDAAGTWYWLLLWLLGCTMKQTTKAKQMRQAWKKDTNKQAKVPEEGADVQAENHISGVRQACQGSKPQSRDSLWITHHHSKHHYATQTTLYYSQTILRSLYGHPTTYFSLGSTVNANKRTLGKCIRKTLFFLWSESYKSSNCN